MYFRNTAKEDAAGFQGDPQRIQVMTSYSTLQRPCTLFMGNTSLLPAAKLVLVMHRSYLKNTRLVPYLCTYVCVAQLDQIHLFNNHTRCRQGMNSYDSCRSYIKYLFFFFLNSKTTCVVTYMYYVSHVSDKTYIADKMPNNTTSYHLE